MPTFTDRARYLFERATYRATVRELAAYGTSRSMSGTKPQWASKQWWIIWYRFAGTLESARPLDRRRRSKATAERIAQELRDSGNFTEVWVVEVNRL